MPPIPGFGIGKNSWDPRIANTWHPDEPLLDCISRHVLCVVPFCASQLYRVSAQ